MSTDLGNRIRRARENAGLTQEAVARAMGLTRAALAHWESGRSNPSYANLSVFSQFVGASLAELAGGDVAPTQNVRPPTAYSGAASDDEMQLIVASQAPDGHLAKQRRAKLFWASVAYECGHHMMECFERPLLAQTFKADYFDGKNLVGHAPVTYDALGRMMLIGALMGRHMRKYLIVADQPQDTPFSQEQLRMAMAADVELKQFSEPQEAANFLTRLYEVATSS